MNEKVPNILRTLLYEYESDLKKYFGNRIFGVYLYNAVALGGFDKDKSDIDFITILNKDFEHKEISIISLIHDGLNNKFKYAKKMEGMYITKENIGKLNSNIEPYLYFYGGKLKNYSCNANYSIYVTIREIPRL